MANKVTIDVEARFVDHVSGGADDAAKSIEDLGKEAQKAQKKVDNLGKEEAKPKVDGDTSKFLKKMQKAENLLKKFGGSKAEAVISAMDKASSVIDKALGKGKAFGNKVWTALVKAKDTASSVLSKVSSLGKSIAGKTWTAVVKVKDSATSVLSKIKNSLFSIKTLIGSIVAGYAIKQIGSTAIAAPISLADSYSSAKIGFSTLLGEAQGQQMMDDLDEFAKKSPFNSSGVISNAQKMLAMGWDAESIVGDMEIIGNAAASTGNLNQGLESIVRAMAQIKTKGKLSAEELNQLAEAGISAKAMLAEELGYGTGDAALAAFTKDQEAGAIGAEKALAALLEGMKKYDGMMDKMANETAEGLMSQLKDTFEVNVVRKWGQGLQDGAKRGLGAVVSLLDKSSASLEKFGDFAHDIGETISNWAADKLENAISRINRTVNSPAFKKATLGGKISLLWENVIANPLADWWDETVVPWWDSTAVPWLTKKAESMGSILGKGLSNSIAALFNLDLGGDETKGEAEKSGVTIGAAFVEGFLEGFDLSKVTDAIKSWASDHKVLATIGGVLIGGKLLSMLGGAVGNIKGLFGGGSGGVGSASTATMTVTAGVVNVNGKGIGTGADIDIPNTPTTPTTTGGNTTVATGGFLGKIFGSTGNAMVNGSGLLGKLASAGYSLTGGAAGSTLSGGAAAAVGGSSILGGILGLFGIGDGVTDFVAASKEKKGSQERRDKLFQGGTKLGMVGAGIGSGAGIGAAIGALGGPIGAGAGALIGAGIGGLGALFGGDKAGKALSDSTDEGGALNNAWQATKSFFTESVPKAWNSFTESASTFFTETVPAAWNNFWTPIGDFFTESIPGAWNSFKEKAGTFFNETIPEKWNTFWDGIAGFFTETVPAAWNTLTEKVSSFFTETIPEKWNAFWNTVGEFFTETVPYALGYAAGKVYTFFSETLPEKWNIFWDGVTSFFTETVPAAVGLVIGAAGIFFTEKVPEFFSSLWNTVSTFFTETVPEWADSIWNGHIYPFFAETIPAFFASLWSSISTFFTETLPEWAEGIWSNHIYPFFTVTIPGFFSSLWSSISTFFTETLPEWAEGIWSNHIYPFFTVTIPGFFQSLWTTISTFFTETLPEWAEGIWNNNVVPFFTETVPGFFSTLWNGVTTFFNEAVDAIAENIWKPIKTFFSETIPNWVSNVIDKAKNLFGTVKDSFLSGFSAGSGDGSGGKKARGGIVGGGSSSMEAFARGGIVGGSTRFIRVNEESPEMIIPLSSQRRDRALKLWAKTGELLGVPRYARGGNTGGGDETPKPYKGYDPEPVSGGPGVSVNINGMNINIQVSASDTSNIAEAIKAQAREIADAVAGIMADAFEEQFENTPIRGGAV